jgi:tetratricopeptide (TPR) repeat protein
MSSKRWTIVVAVILAVTLAGSPFAIQALLPPLAENADPLDNPVVRLLRAAMQHFPRLLTHRSVDPDSPLGRLTHEAEVAERAGNDQKAADLYTQALDDKTVDSMLRVIVLGDRAKAFERLRQYDKAEADLTARLSIEPTFAIHYADRGYFYLRRASYDKALVDFAAGASRDRNEAIYSLGEGRVFSARGEHRVAIEHYTAAIDADPALIEAHLERGSAYNYAAMYAEARADYDQAIALHEAAGETKKISPRAIGLGYLGRGYAALHLGDGRRAIEDFDRVLAVVPKSANALKWRGSAFEATGDRERALADYRAAFALAPDDARLAEQITELERHPASAADPGSPR